jgi:tetratricopeptide (TPR) repeat protein
VGVVLGLCAISASADVYKHCSQSEDLERSIRACTQILERGKKVSAKTWAITYYNRGNAYKAKGDLEHAIADYDKAIALDPKDADSYYNRGNADEAKGDINRAIADSTKAVNLARNRLLDALATGDNKQIGAARRIYEKAQNNLNRQYEVAHPQAYQPSPGFSQRSLSIDSNPRSAR